MYTAFSDTQCWTLMAYHADQASMVAVLVKEAVPVTHLKSSRFHMQTDAVQLAFAVAQMEAQKNCRAMLVDGLIETKLQTKALNYKGGPQAFFSLRCHEKGMNCRRVIFLDYKSTRTMSTKSTGEGLLHFHAILLLEDGRPEKWLRRKLMAVFGFAGKARRFQFNVGFADATKGHRYAGQDCIGITGKLSYMLSHVGTTCSRLGLNEGGKRSRSAPSARRRANEAGQGWAKGNPSNFIPKKILIWDRHTRRIAQAAFQAWYADQRAQKPMTEPAMTGGLYEPERLRA